MTQPLEPEMLGEELQRIIDVADVGDGRRGETHRPAWLDCALECIHDTLCESFSVALLADDLGVHQTHLSRTFRRHIGSTIAQYRRRLRVVGAARSLRVSNAPLALLAFEFGFADQAHLTRELHDHLPTGHTDVGCRDPARNLHVIDGASLAHPSSVVSRWRQAWSSASSGASA